MAAVWEFVTLGGTLRTRRGVRIAALAAVAAVVAGCTSTSPGKPVAPSGSSGTAAPGPAVQLTFRPVVMAPASWTRPVGSATKLARPLIGLPFPVPAAETAYAKLTAAQRQELQTRLTRFDCASGQPDGPAQSHQPYLACDSKDPNEAKMVYLLGNVIISRADITGAQANPPGVSGSTEWTVALTLNSSGATAWAAYTGAHNTGGQAGSASITSCGPDGTPCADYVGVTVDGAVVSSPVLMDAINDRTTQIAGGFTRESATRLASQLSR